MPALRKVGAMSKFWVCSGKIDEIVEAKGVQAAAVKVMVKHKYTPAADLMVVRELVGKRKRGFPVLKDYDMLIQTEEIRKIVLPNRPVAKLTGKPSERQVKTFREFCVRNIIKPVVIIESRSTSREKAGGVIEDE